MYELFDTFNGKVLSRHRTIAAVVRAEGRHNKWWARNGRGAYIPVIIRRAGGTPLSEAEQDQADNAKDSLQ